MRLVHRATPPVKADARIERGQQQIGDEHADHGQQRQEHQERAGEVLSWLFSASSSIGPVVGSDSTTETIAEPGDEVRQQVADVGDEGIERHAQRIFHQQPCAAAGPWPAR